MEFSNLQVKTAMEMICDEKKKHCINAENKKNLTETQQPPSLCSSPQIRIRNWLTLDVTEGFHNER